MIMRAGFGVLGTSVVMSACSAASALGGSGLVKAPVEQQCSRDGLKGCPELVDGVVLYVDGDQSAATRKLRQAASRNVPADLARFARAISVLLPAKSGGDIVAILTGASAVDGNPEIASEELPGRVEPRGESTAVSRGAFEEEPMARVERAQLSIAAQNDPRRLTTESTFPLRDVDKAICEVGGSDAVCVRLEVGPLVITDAMTPPGCATELVIGATTAEGRLGWVAPTNSPGFHGARFLVRPDEWVVVAARNVPLDDSGDNRCYVTWAAFKPRVWL